MDRRDDLPAWRAELRRGLRVAATDPAAAEVCFERAHAMAPERPETSCALGRSRRRAGRLDEARDLLTRALEAEPGFTIAAAELARCLAFDGHRFDEAHVVLDDAARAGAEIGPLAAVRAEILLDQGDRVAARTAARAALAAAASDSVATAASAALARVENADGAASASAGELDAALFAFKRAADLDPSWGAPLVNQGLAFEALGRLEAARRAYHRASAIEADDEIPLVHLGRVLVRLGDRPAARSALETAWLIRPGWPPTACALARLRLDDGERSEATALLEEASLAMGDDVRHWLELASTFRAAGSPARAERCLRAVLDLVPDHAGARLGLADVLVAEGRYLEAAGLAAEARALDPALAAVVLGSSPRVHSEDSR